MLTSSSEVGTCTLLSVQNRHLRGPSFSRGLDEYPSRVDHKVDGVFASSPLPITITLQKHLHP